MIVKVLFFARLREKMGINSIDFMLDQPVTLAQFHILLAAQYPSFAELPQPIVVAINQNFAQPDQLVSVDDEVAFFPPVTGG